MKGKVTMTIVLGATCFFLVYIMLVQFKTVYQTDITSIENMRETELREELASWRTKYEETAQKLQETNNKILEYNQTSQDNQKTKQILEKELIQAETNLGLTDVVGDGIIIILRDSENIVEEDLEFYNRRISVYDLLQLFNELKLAGAEAIEINGVRLTNKSDIALISDSFIKIDNTRLNSPYVVKVIGNQATLESALIQKNSGYIDKIMKPYDKIVEIQKPRQIEINGYSGEWNLRYIEEEN